ncbi:hypothetical protein LshimejAT787_0111560 [Lyophyllum shimeji]|uniref:Uncharacterized protein n=1 Tax=Lyophyllum shimeji TaxID=47721 RepID=A0A9P3UIJ0_LYOSH|nr:hypothetical protein LshimejAT787_0111560 [Lyophyllum shimeji]
MESGQLNSYRQASSSREHPNLIGEDLFRAFVDQMPLILDVETILNPLLDPGKTEAANASRAGQRFYVFLHYCSKPPHNDELLPPPEVMEKLKDIMAKGRFKEPRWFEGH